jgi:hypothetical protein
MHDLEKLKEQVRYNCEISNAQFWGVYSICGLLMRLRSQYRFEHSLKPWQKIDTAKLMEWVGEKEKLWQSLKGKLLEPLRLGGEVIDPFDVESVERYLPPNMCYGAGYATGMKPSFFLGELGDSYTERGFFVRVVEREFVRDLFVSPAMLRGDTIYLRLQVFEEYLWEKIEELRLGKGRQALWDAFEYYGLHREELIQDPSRLEEDIKRIARKESYAVVAHEMGEALESGFPEELWQSFVHSSQFLERLARGIRDLLADTHAEGMLSAIIKRHSLASLAFYVAALDGFRKELFPEIFEAYAEAKQGDWGSVESAAKLARDRALECVRTLVEINRRSRGRGEAWLRREVRRELLQPLGINL